MIDDPLARLRASALEGLTPPVAVPFTRRPRAPRGLTHPEIPADVPRPSHEAVPLALLHEAGRWWRRCAPNWAPSLEALVAQGVVGVRREGGALVVDAGAATYRARGMPAAWEAVVVAALTGRELVPTRRALRAGEVRFAGGRRA